MSARLVRWLLSLGSGGAAPQHGAPRLTIVRHHRVYGEQERPLYRLGVSEAVFESQVATCVAAGLTPMTVRDGLAWLATATRGHRVAFSFDDGYQDNLERALPVLERHGARATLYLAAGLMAARQAPWWDELAHVLTEATSGDRTVEWGGEAVALELADEASRRRTLVRLLPRLRVTPAEQRQRLDALREVLGVHGEAPCRLAELPHAARWSEAGMELGAHTLTHPFLSLLSESEQLAEIAGSVERIRAVTGAEVVGLAYPNGDHDAVTVRAAQAAGLQYAVTTRAGDVRRGEPAFTLVRRGLPEGAVLGPGRRASAHMTLAELRGRFDRLRRGTVESGT